MALLLTLDAPPERAVSIGVLDAVASQLGAAFARAVPAVRRRVGEAAARAVRSAPEYESLLSGGLRGQLGVVDALPVLSAVCRNLAGGVVVTSLGARRAGPAVEGGMRIELLKGDYSEVLTVAGASFQSEGGFAIDWLRWLTLEGDRVIVADYRFSAGFPERSRTGLGVMARPGTWRVPPEFSGTASDNWLTRSLGTMGPDVEAILRDEISRSLS